MDRPHEVGGVPAEGSRLEVDVLSVAGQAVISLDGELDMDTVGILRTAVNGVIDGGTTTILFDCEKLRFVDSTGVGLLVWAHKRLRAIDPDGGILLRRCQPLVVKLMRLTGLDRVISVEAAPAAP